MNAKRMVAVGHYNRHRETLKVADDFADSRQDGAANACDAIVHDPAYVPDWPGFLAHAAQMEAIEIEGDNT